MDIDNNTTINNIECWLEFDDGCSFCWLIKGEYSASLELAKALGGLEDSNGIFKEVSSATIDRIQSWADKNGY